MNETYAKLSFEHEISLIRLRTILLRCIGASINVCLFVPSVKSNGVSNNEITHALSNGIDESAVKHLNIFSNVIEELKEQYTYFKENPPKSISKVSNCDL